MAREKEAGPCPSLCPRPCSCTSPSVIQIDYYKNSPPRTADTRSRRVPNNIIEPYTFITGDGVFMSHDVTVSNLSCWDNDMAINCNRMF